MEQLIPEVSRFITNYPGFTLSAIAHLGIVINRLAISRIVNSERYDNYSTIAEHFISRGTLPLFYGDGLMILGKSESFSKAEALPLTIIHTLIWESIASIADHRLRWRNLLADVSGILSYSLISSFK